MSFNRFFRGMLVGFATLALLLGLTVFVLARSAQATGGSVIFGSTDGHVYSLNATTGALNWQYPATGAKGAFDSSPALDSNGVIFIGSADGNIYALTASNGIPFWHQPFSTGGPVFSSPTVATVGSQEVVFVGSNDGKVYAIYANGANAGMQFWAPFATGGPVASSPAVDNPANATTVFFGSYDTYVYAISATDGSQTWKVQPTPLSPAMPSIFVSSPAVDAPNGLATGVLFIGSDDGSLYKLSTSAGAALGYFTATEPIGGITQATAIHSSPTIANEVVYVGADNGQVYAFAEGCMGQCMPTWTYQTGSYVASRPTVDSQSHPTAVYVSSFDAKVYQFSTSTGTLVADCGAADALYSSPVLVPGVVVGSLNGEMYALTMICGANPPPPYSWGYLTGGPILSSPVLGP